MSELAQNQALTTTSTTFTTFIVFKPFVVAMDLIVLYTGDPFLMHGTIVPDLVCGEFAFFLYQYIQHHPNHGQAEEDEGDKQDL